MTDENRAVYTPPRISDKRNSDLNKPKKKLKWLVILVIVFVVIAGAVMFFTNPRVLNTLKGISTPDIFEKTEKTIKVPVAILTDEEGNKAMSSLGCVVAETQFGVAPLSYFERIKNEKKFQIKDTDAIMEAFGCLMPSLFSSGLKGLPVSVLIGSEVLVEMPTVINGVFSYKTFPRVMKKVENRK
ncbi:MAG: hypothetical protein ACTSXL_00670 [Alphaproteobacteria bacterium]|nr:MAG: hypothetical protein B6I23_03420 [Rickettsiaceae bacterium 4572_127]